MTKNVLLIDSRDSFTYNIVDSFYRVGVHTVEVVDSEKYTSYEEWFCYIQKKNPSHIVLGPGPGSPLDFPWLIALVRKYQYLTCPLLGICLGHQILIEAFFGVVQTANYPVHGKRCFVRQTKYTQNRLLSSIPEKFWVGRYHSLAAYTAPRDLSIICVTDEPEGENFAYPIMAVEHTSQSLFGIQFHPESFLSDYGLTLLQNFIKM